MIKAKLDKHNSYYDTKLKRYKKMSKDNARALRRLSRLALHTCLTSKLAWQYLESI